MRVFLTILAAAIVGAPVALHAQCAEEPPLSNYTGTTQVVCPCFVAGEQAGAVLTAPSNHYPLEVLRIGIAWGSVFNSNPAQIEQAVNLYAGGLPNPGSPIFSLPGPQLIDGYFNEFNIEPLAGDKVINSGPFMVSLEFMNQNANNQYASSVVHDGNGCQSGKNAVYAIPGGWLDACLLNLSGDWVMYAVYRPCTATGISGTFVSASSPAFISRTTPNPFTSSTSVEFILDRPGHATVEVYDVRGRVVAKLADHDYDEGVHNLTWDGSAVGGASLPSGVYFIHLSANGVESVRKVLLAK